MRNLILAAASRIAFEKPHEGKPAHKGESPVEPITASAAAPVVGSVKTEIAGVEIELPVKFVVGHVLSEAEAKALQAHYMRQFANNKNAAFKAWEVKAAAYDAAKALGKAEGERPANPTASVSLLADWTGYAPNVGAAGQTSLEKTRDEAATRRLVEMIAESNEHIASGGVSGVRHFKGTDPAKLPSGKGAADAKAAIVARILASEKQAAHVQRHVDAILAEREAAKASPATAKAVGADDLDF